MKPYFKFSIGILSVLMFNAASIQARINVLEPWFPGQDSRVAEEGTHQFIGSFITGDFFWEMPVQLSYVTSRNSEIGARWSLKSQSGNAGPSDMILGTKYRFLEESSGKPAVIGEMALSVPIADHKQGLGTGSFGLILNWAMEKKLRFNTTYFGMGIRFNGENSDMIQPGNIFFYHLGASWPYQKDLRFHAEFKGFMHSAAKVSGYTVGDTTQEVYLAPGLNYKLDPNRVLSGSLMIGLSNESTKLGLLVGLNF